MGFDQIECSSDVASYFYVDIVIREKTVKNEK